MARRVIHLVHLVQIACGLTVAGCNLLTLDGLQMAGEGGAGPSGVVSSGSEATTGDPVTTSASTSTASSSSATTSGGAGGSSSSSDGGGGSSSGVGGGGASSSSVGGGGSSGGCPGPTFCDQVLGAAVCDDFDSSDSLGDAWETVVANTVDPGFDVVEDPHVSCPRAARITYNGVIDGEQGGWAEMGRRLVGAPTSLTMSARIWREPTISGPEGNLEITWNRGQYGCFLQVRIGTTPASVEVSGRQYDAAGQGVVLGSDYVEAADLDTAGRWMDVDLTVTFGSVGWGSVTLEGVTASFMFDSLDADALCDDGPDAGSVLALVGPPYNSAPTVLHVDDYFVTATFETTNFTD